MNKKDKKRTMMELIVTIVRKYISKISFTKN